MTDRDSQLLAMLKIGHQTSIRGAGLSLKEALVRSRYRELRPGFGPGDLLPLITNNQTLVAEWLDYSANKRTDGGWYLLGGENRARWSIEFPTTLQYDGAGRCKLCGP